MSQSIHAWAPVSLGDPAFVGVQSIPRNLSVPLRAKVRPRSCWSAERILAQNRPWAATFGKVVEPRPTKKATRAGSRETELKEPTVSPMGLPVSSSAVTATTPVQNFSEDGAVGVRDRVGGGGGDVRFGGGSHRYLLQAEGGETPRREVEVNGVRENCQPPRCRGGWNAELHRQPRLGPELLERRRARVGAAGDLAVLEAVRHHDRGVEFEFPEAAVRPDVGGHQVVTGDALAVRLRWFR